MCKYKYEKVTRDFNNWAFGLGNIYSIEDYRQIINSKAANVWQYIRY